ncbi:MAG: hypothetical protein MUE54_07695 [Anaerolineae bacterium]|jgi:hypothetical protein|nr:hypothetical protein [Anaerolineae bacterium]
MMLIDWRLLLVLVIIALLLISCTGHIITPESTAILMPPITLTVHLTQSMSATPLGIATALMMPAPTPITPPSQNENITLSVPNPICYEHVYDGILCLGVVNNPYLTGFKDVQVLVELFKANGTPITAKATALLQQTIPPEGSAPYHVRFEINPSDFGAVRVSVVNFTPLPSAPIPPKLTLSDISNQQDTSGYRISGKLGNPQILEGGGVRMIITLYDTYEHVAGYRVMEIPYIPPTTDMPFILEFVPQIQHTDLRYTIYLEQMP